MSTQLIRNLITTQIDNVIDQAKIELKNEGKKKVEELKEKIPTEEEVIEKLKAEISDDSCSEKGKEKFNKIYLSIWNPLTDTEKTITDVTTKLTEIQMKANGIVEPSGVTSKIQQIVDVLQPITQALQKITYAAPISLAASSGVAASGILISTLTSKIAFSKAKISEYDNLFRSIPNMLKRYKDKATDMLEIIAQLLGFIAIVSNVITRIKSFMVYINLEFEKSCEENNNPNNTGVTNVDGSINVDEVLNALNTGNTSNLTSEQVLFATQVNYNNTLQQLIAEGKTTAIKRIYAYEHQFKNEYNIAFKKITL
tara:strand:- start:2875 stop:3810 length:936 start_codon:yes stop_codon:yes gene_type:complete